VEENENAFTLQKIIQSSWKFNNPPRKGYEGRKCVMKSWEKERKTGKRGKKREDLFIRKTIKNVHIGGSGRDYIATAYPMFARVV